MIIRIFNAIIFSNIWISFGAVGTTLAYYRFTGEEINYLYLILVFFATLFAYNLQYLTDEEINPERYIQSSWLLNNIKLIKITTFSSFVICSLLSLVIFPIHVLIMSLPVFLIVYFYKKGKINRFSLRNIPLIKIIIISFCWMWLSSIIPHLINYNHINWNISLFIFFYVFTITLPFDIRDSNFDNDSLMTFPQIIGKKGTYFFSVSMILFLVLGALYFSKYSLVIFLFVTLLLILPTFKSRKEHYYLFVLDGLLLVFPIFVI